MTAGCQTFHSKPSEACDACWVGDDFIQQGPIQQDATQRAHGHLPPPITDRSADSDVALTGGYITDTLLPDGFGGDEKSEGGLFNRISDHHDESPLVNAAPPIGGLRLGGEQITATEHALRLQDENARMKQAGKKLLSENRRQREEIDKKNELIQRMAKAMEAADEELRLAERTNADLRTQIVELQTKQRELELSTDRMLNSIRTELDDALMREITLTQ